jgi:hypothetical protein
MSNIDPSLSMVVDKKTTALRNVEWGPVIAGALLTAALAFVLESFAIAIGLGVSSTSPTWRDTSVGLLLLSALYLSWWPLSHTVRAHM